MPRLIFVAVYTALTSTLAMGQVTPDPAPPASVAVFMDFDSAPGNSSVEFMKKEVEGLLRPSGIRLDWRTTQKNDGKEAFPGLVVVRFKGHCRDEARPVPQSDVATLGETVELGSTEVVNGHVLPFSQIECDQVRKALAYLDPAAGRSERQKALGLALGRVVAHELYHILARTTTHASDGLARATQSLRDLIAPEEDLSFRAKDSEAIHKGAIVF